MREINLPTGETVLVDDADYEKVKVYRWARSHGYAITTLKPRRVISMHRMILDAPKGVEVDHINNNKLDNRRENLRLCTRSENAKNRPSYVNSTSKYKGVSWSTADKKWVTYIYVDGKSQRIGAFDNELDAAHKYNVAANHFHGRFAYYNELPLNYQPTYQYNSITDAKQEY